MFFCSFCGLQMSVLKTLDVELKFEFYDVTADNVHIFHFLKEDKTKMDVWETASISKTSGWIFPMEAVD